MKQKMKTCPSCDGDGGYYPSPQYRPFDFRTCSTCGGQRDCPRCQKGRGEF